MEIKGIRILITGGCGFIGGYLVKKLADAEANITVLDIFLDSRSIFSQNNLKKRVNFQIIDIRNKKETLNIFKKFKPTFVIHLAAEPIVEKAYLDPYNTFETNIMGTVNILEAVRTIGKVKGIIVASSDKAYGKTTKIYKEDDPLKGDHPYDVSKSCEDLIAQTYYKTYNLPIVITRFGNVYGEGDFHFGRIIPDICSAIIQKKPLLIRSNGKYVRDYIYVDDVVNGYIFLLNNISKIRGQVFNFSSPDNLSVIKLIKVAEKALKVKIAYKILSNAKNEIPYQRLDDAKIRKLGWKSIYSIKETFPKILSWYNNILFSNQ